MRIYTKRTPGCHPDKPHAGLGLCKPCYDKLRRGPLHGYHRIHNSWTPENWDDGWADNKGRFRVYRPDCPRAFKSGYCLRAHVVWWLNTGTVHPKGTVIHHRNEIKTDDKFSNLQMMLVGEHTIHHCAKPNFSTCKQCGITFELPLWRIRSRLNSGESAPRFCSQDCYHKSRSAA
jgi:hypothetical protein